ncbi:MAG: ABC transporter substrate-binding protein, partial [Actinomycetota bacterium]|nr:ABC transporter substrate-binding protein [Actinomycetota bacterium]
MGSVSSGGPVANAGSSASTDLTSPPSAAAASLRAGLNGSGTGAVSTAPSRTAVTGTGTTAAAIPPTGRGWDRRYVHIGVTTASDVGTVGQSLGIKSINPGNLKADAEAMVAYLNAHGGIFGRQLKAEYYDVKTTDNGDAVGQAVCTYFTQDVPVIALLNMTTNGDTPNFDACVAKAHLPTFGWITNTGDDSFYASFHGFYNNMPFPSWSRFARPFVRRLVAQGYFGPWDTVNGRPGTAPAKMGILELDTPTGHQIARLLINELTAVGHAPDPADVIFYSSTQDISGSELKFHTDNVTHITGDELLFA